MEITKKVEGCTALLTQGKMDGTITMNNNNNWGVGVIFSSVKESVTKIQKDAAIRQSKFINQ